MDHLQLPSEGVFVVWTWDINTESEGEELDASREFESEDGKDDDYESDSQSNEEAAAVPMTHTVTFKCIGATKTRELQIALKTVSDILASGNHVPVELFPERDNPYDSRAIAFKALIKDDWHTIGYVVREVTEYVHNAIAKNEITCVKFSWAKYLISWSRTGPAYYAGVDITVLGRWPDAVVKCASTR